MSKSCCKCKATKPLTEFHKQGHKRHSWCKQCYNQWAKETRHRRNTPEQKRRWQLWTRYRIRQSELEEMTAAQKGICAICKKPMVRVCVDHCHKTKAVRGLLCHKCNIDLPAIENEEYRKSAMAYLGLT